MKDLQKSLVDAAFTGDLAGIRACLARGADVNSDALGSTALQMAAFGKRLEAFQLLLESGADVNAVGTKGAPCPAKQALLVRNVPMFVAAIEAGARLPDDEGDLSAWLDLAIVADNVPDATATAILLAHGANFQLAGADGNTALHEAALYDNSGVCLALVRAGAELESLNGQEQTPLQYAVNQRSIDAVRALRALGARTEGIVVPEALDPGERLLIHAALILPPLSCAAYAAAGRDLVLHVLQRMPDGRIEALRAAKEVVNDDDSRRMESFLGMLLAHEQAHQALQQAIHPAPGAAP